MIQALLVYRHVQLLANLSNDIQQKGMPAPFVGGLVASGVSLAFVVQTEFKSGNLPIVATMILACVNRVLFLLLFLKMLAMVYKESRIELRKK